MGFYTQDDLPFYYSLAQTFAIDDRYFCSVIGQTFPNRSYLLAATSFGHLTTSEILPPPGGYKPITGTFWTCSTANGVSWVDYFAEIPEFAPSARGLSLRDTALGADRDVPGPGGGRHASVGFVRRSDLRVIFGAAAENDEHPPTDVRKGEAFVSTIVNAVRNGPNWKDSIIFIVYDEHGGFYDHVAPPRAPQGKRAIPTGSIPASAPTCRIRRPARCREVA